MIRRCAPELKLAGYEELRFAPGMFEPRSDTYFTYILGLRLEQDLVVDLEFVDSFLDTYYRGLCRKVGEDSGLDLDLSKFSVTVEQDGSQFSATIEMFDPFVTGEPLTLRVELSAHAAAQGTEIFGLASPAPKDAPIWKRLGALAEHWRAERPAPVFLNHVYVVPDAETHAVFIDTVAEAGPAMGFHGYAVFRHHGCRLVHQIYAEHGVFLAVDQHHRRAHGNFIA